MSVEQILIHYIFIFQKKWFSEGVYSYERIPRDFVYVRKSWPSKIMHFLHASSVNIFLVVFTNN